MQIFLDSADVAAIRALYDTGMVDGVTTNPSLIAKSGRDFADVIKEIASFVTGDISAEVLSKNYEDMVKEGQKLAEIANSVVVKVPLTVEGLRACKTLSLKGIGVNVTLCFSAVQALLAAKAGAKYVSPFMGRHDDWGRSGVELIHEICAVFDNYAYSTKVLVASVRSAQHVLEAAKCGAEVVTCPPRILQQLYKHPYTDLGLAAFERDWKNRDLKKTSNENSGTPELSL